jgi:Type VI secretion system/phage-baseplate injector OB domain
MVDNPLTQNEDPVSISQATVRPSVSVGLMGLPLMPDLSARLLRTVVDNDMHLPGMFELTFLDIDGQTLLKAGIDMGSQITVYGGPPTSGRGSLMPQLNPLSRGTPLIIGEVTAIEGLIQGLTIMTVVRGYTMAHRLQRAKKSRSYINMTDADIARQIAATAGLTIGDVVTTSTTHEHLPQVNQTDWEFLQWRAMEIGFETGVGPDAKFYFRPSTESLTAAGGGLGGMGRSLLNSATNMMMAATVEFPDTLISFRPRVTAGNVTPDVEVRVWDPMSRVALAEGAMTPFGVGDTPNSLGRKFTSNGLESLANSLGSTFSSASQGNLMDAASSAGSTVTNAQNALSSATGGLLGSPVGYLGPPPSATARVQVDNPMASQQTMATTGPMVAGAYGSNVGSTYAEAEGECMGNSAIQPGSTVTVKNVPYPFAGDWKISRAKHIFDDSEHGYRVVFSAHGRQDRSMLGLTSKGGSKGGSSSPRPTIDGVVCGVVSNASDPLGKGRVKVTLPWLSPMFETDWAPNIQFHSGQKGGAIFMPNIGDEVIVAFEFGDPRRPYVLGGMMNNYTEWSIAKSGPIMAGGLMGLASGAGAIGGQLAGAAIGSTIGMAAGPGGAVIGGMIGSAVGGAVAADAMAEVSAAGASVAPGMLSEVHHRGYVSPTGNALLFYDYPLLDTPSTTDVTASATAMSGTSMGTGSTGATTYGDTATTTPPGMGALGSAVRLGSQMGEIGVTIDQVNGGVNISSKIIPGVTIMPLPNINITADNGFINMGVGSGGTMMIDGGMNLIIKSSELITLQATAINIVGLPLVNGVPIPI